MKCAAIGKDSPKGDDKQEDRARSKQHEEDLPYKLENAPIPSIHDGPQVLRERTGLKDEDDFKGERSKRHISQKDGLNPQRPRVKTESTQQEGVAGNQTDVSHIHHPGHSSELSSSHPINSYNYYKVLNMYGSAFQYGNNPPFKGYTQTANIGIVPPKGTDAKDYYNSISNLQNYPTITQHSLYENQKFTSRRYGQDYNDQHYMNNAYKNVLTGLAMWSIMNGLVTGKRYTVYDHKTIPKDYSRNIVLTNDTLTECIEDAPALCGSYSQPICINNGTTFCVSSTVTPCQEKCINTSMPCDKCEETNATFIPCATYTTVSKSILEEQRFNGTSYPSDVEDVVLCVTTLVVPQIKDVNKIPCDRSSC